MGKLVLLMQSDKVDIYSPRYDGEPMTEFEKFLIENEGVKHPQLKAFFDAILSSIEKIQECGARENLFRNEGGTLQQNYRDDPVMLDAVDDLRDIDRDIKRIARQAQTDYEDYNAISAIIKSITL